MKPDKPQSNRISQKKNTATYLGKSGRAFEVGFYEKILCESPNQIDVLLELANHYTHVGEYRKGLELDERLARLRPDDPGVLYNLSCSLALTGKIDEALDMLDKAIRHGYDDLEHIQKDADLQALHEDPRFLELLHQLVKEN